MLLLPLPMSSWVLVVVFTMNLMSVYGDGCKDKNFQCAYWSSIHQCELNPEYMMTTCPLSCGNPCVCPVETDDIACNCIERAKAGHCETQPNNMNVVCRTTCTKRHTVLCPILNDTADPNAGLSTHNTWFLTQVDEVCNPGYQSVSPANKGSKFCSKDAVWIDDAFYAGPVACERVNCGDPPDITHGIRTYNSTLFQSQVVYLCHEGYKLVPDTSVRNCTESATWSGVDPVCEEIRCPTTDLPVTYAVYAGQSVTYNSTVVYTCVKGYNHTSGDLERTCQESEQWSGTKPTCTIIHCSTPISIPNTTLRYSSTEYQSIATYDCIMGYKRTSGDQSRYCLATSHWSGSDLFCEIVNCGSAPLIIGAKSNSSGEEYLDQTSYECFYQEDKNNLVTWTFTCGADGKWFGESLTCAAIRKRSFVPELLEADGSFGVGVLSLSIVGTIMVIIVVLDIPTVMRQSVYLKRNLRRFRQRTVKHIKTLRNAIHKRQMWPFHNKSTISIMSLIEEPTDKIVGQSLMDYGMTEAMKQATVVNKKFCSQSLTSDIESSESQEMVSSDAIKLISPYPGIHAADPVQTDECNSECSKQMPPITTRNPVISKHGIPSVFNPVEIQS